MIIKGKKLSPLAISLFLIWIASPIIEGKKWKTLTIAGFQPLSGSTISYIGKITLPAGQLAIKDINARPDILPDYNLTMEFWNTEYKSWVATKSFIDAINNPPIKIATFGPLTTVGSRPVASLTKYWNLVTVTSGVSSAALINRDIYPYFFTTETTDVTLNPIRIAMLRRFNWTRIATIHHISELQEIAAKNFIRDADKLNFTLITTEAFFTSPVEQLKSIKEKGAKIILLFASVIPTIRLFCEVYHQKMYGSHYVWFITYGYIKNWWRAFRTDANVNCTSEQLELAMSSYFTLNNVELGSDETTVSGMNSSQYIEHYNNFVVNPLNSPFKYFQTNGYDAMWALALALNRTENILKKNGSSLSDFNYSNTMIRSILFDEMSKTDFIGISGPVRFKSGSRISDVYIYQNQIIGNESNVIPIGLHYGITNELQIYENKIYWIGGAVPADTVSVEVRIIGVSQHVFITVNVLAIAAIILAIVFLSLNIMKRKRKHIKMSSPNINNLFLIGCIMGYIAAITFGIDSNNTPSVTSALICPLRVWILSIGFSIAFGSLLSKTWRVYRIFTSGKKTKIVIKDHQLIAMVVILICIDLCYLTIWQLADPLKGKQILVRIEDSSQDLNTVIRYYNVLCSSQNSSIWLGIIYGMKLLLLVFGTFLAWETRYVTIPALNDSRYIGMSIYNTTLLCVIAIIISQFLGSQVDANFAVIAGFIIFGITVTMCLVFVPKVIHLKRNGFAVMQSNNNTGRANSRVDSMDITFGKGRNITCEDKVVEEFIRRIKNCDEANGIVTKIRRRWKATNSPLTLGTDNLN